MSKDGKKKGKRKEMTIILKSKPLNSDPTQSTQFTQSNRKPKDFKKKGTRGSSWIG